MCENCKCGDKADAVASKPPMTSDGGGFEGADKISSGWVSVDKKLPNEGVEVLLFNEAWKHEDWNPNGVRIGFLDGVGGWTSAYWCLYHDEYHTRTSDEDDKQFSDFKAANQIPTHWMMIRSYDGAKPEAQP